MRISDWSSDVCSSDLLGASALVLECHRPEEKTRVQSLNDFIVFGLMAIGSFSSGGLLSAYGWNMVLWVSFVPLALAVVALALAMRRKSPALARRSEDRRVGNEGVSTCRSRWSPDH